MSRTYRQQFIMITNGTFEGLVRYTGTSIKPYCSLFHKTSLKVTYTQVSFGAKEKMRNANRTLKKRTRQYNKKQISLGILEWKLCPKLK